MVATIHDVSPFVLPSALPPIRALYLRKVFSMIAKRARVLLADTQWQALRIVEALPASAGKIQVVPPACDPVFHPESGPPVRRVLGRVDAPFILAVGTLEPRKNIEHLVTAWKDSSFEGDLVLVGRWGWKYDRLLRLLDSFGHRDILEDGGRSWTLRYGRRICRYEYLPAEDLADLYRRSRCLVYPSVFEGFGLPVLEAMACGCPVITSRDSAMEEVAADAGWYCDPDDPDSITATIEARLSGEEECRRRVLIGLERACEFSQEAFANRLLAVYQEARR
jgi:alpha-1,3-rhamnosyl/mannosyltransferase